MSFGGDVENIISDINLGESDVESYEEEENSQELCGDSQELDFPLQLPPSGRSAGSGEGMREMVEFSSIPLIF